jgi:hypothetical protein
MNYKLPPLLEAWHGESGVMYAKRNVEAARAPLLARIKEMEAERDTFYMDYRMKCDEAQKKAEAEVERLRELLQGARDYVAGVSVQLGNPSRNGALHLLERIDAALKEKP